MFSPRAAAAAATAAAAAGSAQELKVIWRLARFEFCQSENLMTRLHVRKILILVFEISNFGALNGLFHIDPKKWHVVESPLIALSCTMYIT